MIRSNNKGTHCLYDLIIYCRLELILTWFERLIYFSTKLFDVCLY